MTDGFFHSSRRGDGALNPADAEALDALVSAGFSPGAASEHLRGRAARIMNLLALLEPHAAPSSTLAESTEALALTSGSLGRLGAAGAAAVDAAVEAGFAPIPGDALASRVAALVGMVDVPPPTTEFRERLARATLAAVQREIDREEALRRLAGASELNPSRGVRRFTLTDVATAAAVVLVGVGVVWPVAASWRENARQLACASNLSNAALGFSMYANDHRGRLPAVTAGFGGAGADGTAQPAGTWWNVGEPARSHSANLFALAREGYASLDDLSCPGNRMSPTGLDTRQAADWRSPEQVSFSYQLPARQMARWNGPVRIVVLADKSPVVDRARRGESFDPHARSLNHRGFGQNIMTSDGVVVFMDSPVLPNGDNIWLPKSQTAPGSKPVLKGVERPETEDDAFVAP